MIVPRINLTHNLLKTIKTFCGFTNTGVTNIFTHALQFIVFFFPPISELPLISHSFLEQLKTQQYFPLIQIPQTLNVNYLNADSMATSPSCPGTSSSLKEWPLALMCKQTAESRDIWLAGGCFVSLMCNSQQFSRHLTAYTRFDQWTDFWSSVFHVSWYSWHIRAYQRFRKRLACNIIDVPLQLFTNFQLG